jgi:hypothetical protein
MLPAACLEAYLARQPISIDEDVGAITQKLLEAILTGSTHTSVFVPCHLGKDL